MVRFMKAILFALAFASMIYSGFSSAFAVEPIYRDCTVTVAAGDTLWDIAGRYNNNGEDVRLVIDRIARANSLKSKHLQPGQVLKVPVAIQDDGLMLAKK